VNAFPSTPAVAAATPTAAAAAAAKRSTPTPTLAPPSSSPAPASPSPPTTTNPRGSSTFPGVTSLASPTNSGSGVDAPRPAAPKRAAPGLPPGETRTSFSSPLAISSLPASTSSTTASPPLTPTTTTTTTTKTLPTSPLGVTPPTVPTSTPSPTPAPVVAATVAATPIAAVTAATGISDARLHSELASLEAKLLRAIAAATVVSPTSTPTPATVTITPPTPPSYNDEGLKRELKELDSRVKEAQVREEKLLRTHHDETNSLREQLRTLTNAVTTANAAATQANLAATNAQANAATATTQAQAANAAATAAAAAVVAKSSSPPPPAAAPIASISKDDIKRIHDDIRAEYTNELRRVTTTSEDRIKSLEGMIRKLETNHASSVLERKQLVDQIHDLQQKQAAAPIPSPATSVAPRASIGAAAVTAEELLAVRTASRTAEDALRSEIRLLSLSMDNIKGGVIEARDDNKKLNDVFHDSEEKRKTTTAETKTKIELMLKKISENMAIEIERNVDKLRQEMKAEINNVTTTATTAITKANEAATVAAAATTTATAASAQVASIASSAASTPASQSSPSVNVGDEVKASVSAVRDDLTSSLRSMMGDESIKLNSALATLVTKAIADATPSIIATAIASIPPPPVAAAPAPVVPTTPLVSFEDIEGLRRDIAQLRSNAAATLTVPSVPSVTREHVDELKKDIHGNIIDVFHPFS
jgi:hypothetical protein